MLKNMLVVSTWYVALWSISHIFIYHFTFLFRFLWLCDMDKRGHRKTEMSRCLPMISTVSLADELRGSGPLPFSRPQVCGLEVLLTPHHLPTPFFPIILSLITFPSSPCSFFFPSYIRTLPAMCHLTDKTTCGLSYSARGRVFQLPLFLLRLPEKILLEDSLDKNDWCICIG